ncbi:MAG: ABC transporter ATP-binding protein [Armatimonadota bacterium]
MNRPTTEVVIETRALSKHYGRVRAVDGLDLAVPRGSLFGFLGPNGAGKSTTIRMLTGLVRPTRGEARVLGVPVQRRLALGNRLGALVEEPAFYAHLSAWQNLWLLASLSGAVREEELRDALATVGLVAVAHRRVGTFSHGMRQRLAIAQALVPRPELLILDEPASGLDPEGMAEVRKLLASLREAGMTIFLSSHLLAEVEAICTHVAVVAHGQVVAQGEVGEMLAVDGARTRFAVDDPERALELFSRIPSVEVERGAGRFIEARANELDAADLNEVLVKGGVRVYQVLPMRQTLESFYLETVRAGRENQTAASS